MANFIEEVDEEVRRDRLEKAWKRWSPYAIGLVVLLLAGVAGHQVWKNWQTEKAAAAGAAFTAALNQAQAGKPADAAQAFASMATGKDGYALLARFQQGAMLIEAKDVPAAIAAYDAIAADSGIAQRFRDLANYLAAFHGFDTLDADGMRRHLAAIGADSPWYANARELLALAELKAGNRDGARQQLTALADDPLVPAGLRGRAAELLAALGGPVQ
ncbi:tetratricopeptide repeat protein [Ferrovibrio sp.]|uniref:tetratricopeptide repeat protein n=1 Tax=Ferrovibrio sp. TaxID=1917215 RepID=UPI00260E87F9|nr:tetratricopeptide repeat protein [Ferrovibrio sp.]